jgi:hypothetical protein
MPISNEKMSLRKTKRYNDFEIQTETAEMQFSLFSQSGITRLN